MEAVDLSVEIEKHILSYECFLKDAENRQSKISNKQDLLLDDNLIQHIENIRTALSQLRQALGEKN